MAPPSTPRAHVPQCILLVKTHSGILGGDESQFCFLCCLVFTQISEFQTSYEVGQEPREATAPPSSVFYNMYLSWSSPMTTAMGQAPWVPSPECSCPWVNQASENSPQGRCVQSSKQRKAKWGQPVTREKKIKAKMGLLPSRCPQEPPCPS